MMKFLFAILFTLWALLWEGSCCPAAIMPTEPDHVISLDGTWRFKLEQALEEYVEEARQNWYTLQPIKTPTTFEPFYTRNYKEDDSWHDVPVPGNWEMAGYSWATYNQPDNSSGFYRKWFKIPASWANRRVVVDFDGVQTGAEIWLNGKPVQVSTPSWGRSNYHESGKTAWQADLTPQVQFGRENLLALRVTKNTLSSDMDSGDFFLLGGIHRSVTLFTVPQAHLEDLTVTTRVSSLERATVQLDVLVSGKGKNPLNVTARLGSSLPAVTAPVNKAGKALLKLNVPEPRLWSAEHPNLYRLALELKDSGGQVVERIEQRLGIREVSIREGILLVNGVPVKLAGVCRHDIHPDMGTAVNEELWRKDLEMMKEANINAIRTSHYPYGRGFYDLCDEMGFYVLDELPFDRCRTNDETLRPAFLQRTRETIGRDKNHPSVIIWGIGNENDPGVNLQTVADAVKKLDPTRPRLVSCQRADKYGVELDDAHYPTLTQVKKDASNRDRRARWPMIYSENPNQWDVRLGADYGALDLWVHVLKRNWDIIWTARGIVGAFLWEWQHRAVADQCPIKIYPYDPETGLQYLKLKGLTDAWRNPRPELYHVKMIYAPIKVKSVAVTSTVPGSVVLDVSNHYSFTNLKDLKTTWRLFRAGASLAGGTEHLSLSPRSHGKIKLPLPKSMGEATHLELNFLDARGKSIVKYLFSLKEESVPSLPTVLPFPAGTIAFPRFQLVTSETVVDRSIWRRVDRKLGILANIRINGEPSTTDPSSFPFDEVQTVQADVLLEDDPTKVVGQLSASSQDLQLSYSLAWTGPPNTKVQELGWIFDVPARFDQFSWKRQGVWSVYPKTHIGRSLGTALPQSAQANLTRVPQLDAFDFNSTKYDCHWATMTDLTGEGLRLEFKAGQRHHVRGAVGDDSNYRLIVNRQCTPPYDFSSNIVEDFFLELGPGDLIQGSFFLGMNPPTD